MRLGVGRGLLLLFRARCSVWWMRLPGTERGGITARCPNAERGRITERFPDRRTFSSVTRAFPLRRAYSFGGRGYWRCRNVEIRQVFVDDGCMGPAIAFFRRIASNGIQFHRVRRAGSVSEYMAMAAECICRKRNQRLQFRGQQSEL